jgi:hypothetical protein
MNMTLNKIIISAIIIIASGLFVDVSANAATLEDAKTSTGKMVHPKLYRKLTDEEKKNVEGWPDKTNREMTQEEADEYFSYIANYQSENNTNIVPAEAYDYIQYIAQNLDTSQNSKITDELRSDAEKYVNKLKQKDSNKKKKELFKKETKQKSPSLWDKITNWFKL